MASPPQGFGVKVPVWRYDEKEVLLTDDYHAVEMEADEIDTGAETSPKEVLTPPSGHCICVRGVFLFTTSTSGEIEAYLTDTNMKLAKLYPSKFSVANLPKLHKHSQLNEGVSISWSGLDAGAKIYYVILYKFIKG